MKKRFACIVLAAVMVLSLMGCTVTKTETRTEVVTDASGKTTTTTTTITNENGKVTEKTETLEEDPTEQGPIVATITFVNETGEDIYGLYFTSAKSDSWGGNALGDDIMEDGDFVRFDNALTYTLDEALWDLKTVDKDGNTLEFNDLDMTLAADPTNIGILLTSDPEAGTYSVTIE